MKCDELRPILDQLSYCQETAAGACVMTHCYYPSFDRVRVFVARDRSGYRVTDSGEAAAAAVQHGRDDFAVETGLRRASEYYDVGLHDGALVAAVDSPEWLPAAILAVANAAAMAAKVANEHTSRAFVNALQDRIGDTLKRVVPAHHVTRGYAMKGHSGIEWPIDYAVLSSRRPLLIKALKPHRNSINSNYATFGDIGDEAKCFSVYDKPVREEGQALIRQVARLVPVSGLEPQTREVVGGLAI